MCQLCYFSETFCDCNLACVYFFESGGEFGEVAEGARSVM